MKRTWIASLLLSILLTACAPIPTPQERLAHADALAAARGWQAERIAAGRFTLQVYLPGDISGAEMLTIYIEGDGFAWVDGATPSLDPTPRESLGLQLALAHPDNHAAYLARPCQYVQEGRDGCPQRYWTQARFSPEVIEAMDRAIETLKRRIGAMRLTLVGYSGGGAVAALLAARRSDVVRLVTVAGNLDHRTWTAYHHLVPLSGSLNPADAADRLARLPQVHFIGSRDRVIPPSLARQWPQAFTGLGQDNLRIIGGFDHVCCWVERWPELFFRE
jgi:pimeloyl-ACP methyl ester carboxylesterase